MGADWAVANGDLETLGHLAGRLAELVRDHHSLRAALREIQRLGQAGSQTAIERWHHLKPQLAHHQ